MNHTTPFLAALALAAALLPAARAQPANPPSPGATDLSAIVSGKMFSRAALAYQNGEFADYRVFSIGAILVRHPAGNLLFDSGFGQQVDEHVKTMPLLMRWLSPHEKCTPVTKQLAQNGIGLSSLKAVVLTHAHWDHVSGLADLPGVPVWVSEAEMAFVGSGHHATMLARQLGTASYVSYTFGSGPYKGFGASHDVFGDGSVVLVPAPGHTPGSIIAFITLANGKRYALVGDLAWQIEGIERPAQRPWIARLVADHDAATTRTTLAQVHALKASDPGLIVVPAHDARVWEALPRLPLPEGGTAEACAAGDRYSPTAKQAASITASATK